MKIGIDGRVLCRVRTGIGRYLVNILKVLQRIDADNEYVVYLHRDVECFWPKMPHWDFKVIKYPYPFSIGNIWLNSVMPFVLRSDRIDIFWCPEQISPLFKNGYTKTVVTVHDVIGYILPYSLNFTNYMVNRFLLRPSLRAADSIVAVSDSTKNDIINLFNISPDKIQRIYEGVDDVFSGEALPGVKASLSTLEVTPYSYILYVGTIEYRKNLEILISAYDKLPRDIKGKFRLVLAGTPGYKSANVFRLIEEKGLEDKVIISGYVDDAMLKSLYVNAAIFVYPSMYEGFGLPILEALSFGKTVVAANTSSIPEVMGVAGYMFEPGDSAQLADIISGVLTGKKPKIDKSIAMKRACQFSWDRTARELLKLFDTMIAVR